MSNIESTSYERTVNAPMRHRYRVRADAEKAMQANKDQGLVLHDQIAGLGNSSLDRV